ncbi:MAG: vanillate O-demethylase oxidoreductase VanB [SAR86 cluster bacterium]|uniref:Vanillate O-demethylase oxidoreductase VanB n=1 Tax=SAR86 cluster bacterium TaxID=2030880 RepID=A0A2A4WYD2_9GAMM|nr:MAG: vanillate O-demethylase oxidoreductase VanB [SAR86 cluster bacterium]
MEDKIEKTVELKASIERVWRALTDHNEFGEWFQVALEKPFAVGEKTEGNITYPGYEHMRLEAMVETMDTNTLFAFSWCPVPDESGNSPLGGMQTLVEFKLEAIESGTRLTIIESGFAALPEDVDRVAAFQRNAEGWEGQTKNIAAHVES